MKDDIHGENPALDPYWCMAQQEQLVKELQCDYIYGGYMEDRSFVWRGHYHQNGFTHYGVDYCVPEGTPVFLPRNGSLVCLEHDPDPNGGWGGRAVYEIHDVLKFDPPMYLTDMS